MKKLLILVTYTVKGDGKDFIGAVKEQGLDSFFRAEDGCLKYDYFLAEGNSCVVLLVEIWENAEKQKAHCQTESFKKLSFLKEKFVEKVTLDRYEI